MTTSVIVGGSSGIGHAIALRLAKRGDDVIIITSRDRERADAAARQIGPTSQGLSLNLSQPDTIAAALADVPRIDALVMTATEQGFNSLREFDIAGAIKSVIVKLIGYTETVRVLRDRLSPQASVVLFGGLAKERPYPGSTIVTAYNGGITGLVKDPCRGDRAPPCQRRASRYRRR
jgi:NAD(P)-dependent dehydrogenase (short-subunit alcohol dehydrogenase family)